MPRSHPSRPAIVVDPPPTLEADEGAAGVLTSAVPMLGSLGSVALVATMATQSGGSGQRSLLAAGAFLLGTLAFVLVQLDRLRVRRTRRRDRRPPGLPPPPRRRPRTAPGGGRRAARPAPPPPSRARRAPPGRRRGARLGAGRRPSRGARSCGTPWATARRPLAPEPPAPSGGDEPDPAALDALQRLLAAHARVPGLPLTLDLRAADRVVVEGDREAARVARAVARRAGGGLPPAGAAGRRPRRGRRVARRRGTG